MNGNETETMADQAFRIYDRRGEDAMTRYMLENRQVPDPFGRQERHHLLRDGSYIELLPEEHRYRKDDGEERPASWPPAALGLDLDVPLLAWPNSGSVLNRLAERAMDRAQEELSSGTDGICLDLAETLREAPGIAAALEKAFGRMGQEEMPSRLVKRLDSIESDCADLLEELLPDGQFSTLVEASKRKIQEQGGA